MALVFSTQSLAYFYFGEFCQHMAQIKLNTIQIVQMQKLLIQIVHMVSSHVASIQHGSVRELIETNLNETWLHARPTVPG